MFNITVINIKDIIKYLVTFTLIIVIIVGITRYLIGLKDNANISNELNSKINFISQNSFLACLDETLPSIEHTNEEINKIASEDDEEQGDILHKILQVELAQIDAKQEEVPQNTAVAENTTEQPQEQSSTEQKTEVVTQNPIASNPTNTYGAVQLKNETGYSITPEMLVPDVEVNKSNIVIFHTHTCESYTATEQNPYTPTGTYRTTDLNYTVARVGDELTNYLTQYGYNVVHDKTYHDYPAYSGSYNRSLETVQNVLAQNPSDIVIDLHRDAIGSNSNYAPTVRIGEDYAAQLMFVIGTNGGGLWHPNWNQNLKFAIKIQEKAEEMYPGLFKPIILRNSRYNQHLAKAASIIEVGATGNTLEQCMTSMKYLAEVMHEAMQ